MPARTGPPRRRLTAGERREGILRAALDVFGRRGYHGASIDDIAQAAGISKALIYEHFASKKALQESLMADHAGELFARLAASAREGHPAESRLHDGLDAFFAFVGEDRQAWRMLVRDSADPELGDVQARFQDQAALLIVGLMESEPIAAATTPEERERTIRMYAHMLSGAMQGLAAWWLDHPDVAREVLVARAMEFAWLGLERLHEGAGWPEARAGR